MAYYAEMCRFSPPDIGQYGFREASAAYTSGKSATTFYWGRVLSHLYQQAPDGAAPGNGGLAAAISHRRTDEERCAVERDRGAEIAQRVRPADAA